MSSGKSLSGSLEELIVKAFYVALGQFERQISSDMAQEIQTVAFGADSDIKQINKLEGIAKKEPEFYEIYEKAYKEMIKLCESQEKSRSLSTTSTEASVPNPSGIIENLSAPNPQELAKESTIKWGADFLPWVSQSEIRVKPK